MLLEKEKNACTDHFVYLLCAVVSPMLILMLNISNTKSSWIDRESISPSMVLLKMRMFIDSTTSTP